jgi:hypothetical protein
LKRRTGDISATRNPFESELVRTLRKIVAVLHEKDIHYWIDCGTLLGLIRDQKIIPWDDDMELGAWITDKPAFDNCLRDFEERGLIITVNTSDKLGLALPGGLPYRVRILFYDLVDRHAVRGGIVGTNFFGRSIGYIMNVLDDALQAPDLEGVSPRVEDLYLDGDGRLLSAKLQDRMRDVLVRFARFLPHPLTRLSLNLFKSLPVRTRFRWEVPEHFLSETRAENFYGIETLIPTRAEEYLMFRYGEDWRKPTRYWVDRTGVMGITRHKSHK